MCGIVGAIAGRDVAPILVDGLRRLEYRGYDSAGIALLNQENQQIQRVRTLGKVQQLADAVSTATAHGRLGIAHTRWATHGVPNETNAHPHISCDNIALVHNGIIENHDVLRNQLISAGYQFDSDTDSEVAVHTIHKYLKNEHNFLNAVHKAAQDFDGAFAFGIINKEDPERIIATRRGSPLVIGLGDGEFFIASDPIALLPVANQFIYLEDNDIAEVTKDGVKIFDTSLHIIQRDVHRIEGNQDSVTKGKYRHFMLKEIFEQPRAVCDTLEGRLSQTHVLPRIFGVDSETIFASTKRIKIVACGTSYHAGIVGKYWLEDLVGIPTTVEIASEFRYRNCVVEPNTLFVCITQSGETADTLAAMRKAKQLGFAATLAICNVPESTAVREADLSFLTRAGIEIGVASTKAFTTQLTSLLLLLLSLRKDKAPELVKQIKHIPNLLEQTLELNDPIKKLATQFADKEHTLFLGRGLDYPIALEGALKLKEISYIHAEAYPAGELKHGPLALVDKNMPVVAIAPNDELLEKLKSNLSEVAARGGKLIIFADAAAQFTSDEQTQVITMPHIESSVIAPLVYTIPLQLLAYHVAVIKGTDVDQPRNLAKSVTVE